MTPAQREAILAEVKGGNKITAIKLCREATGLGLAEAKDWVEKLETSPDALLSPAPEAGALSPVADLLFAGRKIDAIKLYREQVKPGAGLKESKDFVERLETSPDAQLSPAPEAGALSPVADLLFAGRKIDAIKLYREQVKPGAGLKESKEAVEQLEAGLRAQHPEKFSAKAKSGCTAVFAVLAVLIAVLVWVRL